MRIRSIDVRNFRAIEHFSAQDLSDFVVIAGPNGCGKSTVLDAVRLLKSLYVHEEWKRWFQEFGINVDRAVDFTPLFRDGAGPAHVRATFELSSEEREFIADRADNIALAVVLSETERNIGVTGEPPVLPPSLTEERVEALKKEAEGLAVKVKEALDESKSFEAAVEITGAPALNVAPSASTLGRWVRSSFTDHAGCIAESR